MTRCDPSEAGEVMVAYEVSLEEDNETFALDKLTLDQLRMLCKNVGVRYVNKCSKFQCRKALYILAQYQEQLARDGLKTVAISAMPTNNIVRITNIIFSHEFLDSFLRLNDIKNRVDHETHQLPADFWEDVAEAMNGSVDDDDTALQLVINEDDEHYNELTSLNLQQFDVMTSTVIRKKVNHLMKVRKEIQKNMTLSGEHDSDPYNFVDVAIKNVGGSGLTTLGCYYFFKRCEDNPEVDVSFANEMDKSLKGNTDTTYLDSKVANTYSSGKKRTYEAIEQMSNAAQCLVNEMKETNRLAKQSNLISLAQHLGKQDILEQLLASVASSCDD
jgi:hypothetical protein